MKRWTWVAPGDVNAFFGLMLDNVANLILLVSLLSATFQFPVDFAVRHMVPGTALGVLCGDLCFTWMAIAAMRREGRTDRTAMPLGLDTPSTFGMVFLVLGPAYRGALERMGEADAARFAWQVGVCAILVSGVFKVLCAFAARTVRRIVPRAGLLGSLAAIALVLISFLPALDIFSSPIVGFVSLGMILVSLVARLRLPGGVPGALVSLVAGTVVFLLLERTGNVAAHPEALSLSPGWLPPLVVLPTPEAWQASLSYLPVVLPFALATVVGGIDCTESAAAAGDEYDTRNVILVEAVATLAAGLCGGVIQTTPYIGHPAYKAMGGRAGYTLATGLVIALLAFAGLFGGVFALVPRAAIFPILIFVGLEITSQSFHATPVRHFPAVALACVPALAYLVSLFTDNVIGSLNAQAELSGPLAIQLQTLRGLSAGFIVSGMLWAAALAKLIDRRLMAAAGFFAVAAVASLFGVIHSPLPGNRLFWPWDLPELPAVAAGQGPIAYALGYAALAGGIALFALWRPALAEQDTASPAAQEP